MTQDLHRWIIASINNYFQTNLDTAEIPLYIEGAPRDTSNLEDWVELRTNGPHWEGGTQVEDNATISINCFFMSKMNDEDNYRIHKNIGLVETLMLAKIPIYKLGDGTNDDQSFLTCLTIVLRGKEKLRANYLGQVDQNTQLLRATVEADYEFKL